MNAPFIRSHYNYDVKQASDAVAVESGGPSLTVQSMSEDADINVLMKRYGILGKFPENPFVPSYGDFTEVRDFRTALHAIQDASESFMLYPADFRARFRNDPQEFLDFCSNRDNIPEMRKLGLLKEQVSGGTSGVDGKAAAGAAAVVRAGGEDRAAAGGAGAVGVAAGGAAA